LVGFGLLVSLVVGLPVLPDVLWLSGFAPVLQEIAKTAKASAK
jgi:hypothetical protein